MLTDKQDEALEKVALKIVGIISPIYQDADGQPYLWEWKIERDRRSTRAALLIYCNDETVRHKEAAQGLIARALRPLMIRGKVRIMAGASGVRFK
jgi:hypothetical protein